MLNRLCLALALALVVSGCVAPAPQPAAHVPIDQPFPGAERVDALLWLQARRSRTLTELARYADARRFPGELAGAPRVGSDDPHHDPASPSIHAFIAPNGNRCALAHLIEASGRGDLVRRLADEQNGVCVGLSDDAELQAWVLESGLTLEECVLIQRPAFDAGWTAREPDDPVIEAITAHLGQVVGALRARSDESLRVARDRLLEVAAK